MKTAGIPAGNFPYTGKNFQYTGNFLPVYKKFSSGPDNGKWMGSLTGIDCGNKRMDAGTKPRRKPLPWGNNPDKLRG